MYRVLLIDDERLVLASLRRRIDWEACGFSVCGEAFNGKDGLSKIGELHPDLVFTDIRMPGISGLDLIGQAQKEFPSVRFVVISGYSEFEYAKRAIEYGVLGFCVKPFDEEEIHGLLRHIREQFDARRSRAERGSFSGSASFRPGDKPQKVDWELLDLGISPAEPKWILEILGEESGASEEDRPSGTRWWRLTAAGGRRFLLAGERADMDAETFFSGSRIPAGMSTPFYSGEELERAALEARVAAYGYFFGKPGFHRLQGKIEHEELTAVLRDLRSAFSARDLGGIQKAAETFRDGDFTIRDAFRFYNTAALLPQGEVLPLRDDYRGLTEPFPDIGALTGEVARVLCESAAALSGGSRSDVMRRILLYVNEHYDDPELGVGKISELFGFNQNYVSQMFKKSEQEGFTAYLTRVRMGHAIQLLRESDCQIREVGERCGYSDYFYFARVFRKYTGRSPGEYREEAREGRPEET